MLTSFFGKSNPINYLILGVFIFVGYLWETFSGAQAPNTFLSFGFHAAFCLLSVLGMLLLDFIIRKNHLTKNNTFAILFFSCFMVMLPVIFSQQYILLANFFLLLSFRRMMSLRTDKNSSKKILDASIWITAASIFHFWSLLFFVPLWIAIIQKPNSNYKQMLIPITGFVAVLMINTAYQLLATDSYSWPFERHRFPKKSIPRPLRSRNYTIGLWHIEKVALYLFPGLRQRHLFSAPRLPN